VKSAPRVSVVTPFCNTQKFLSECIESFLRQTYENWEYILVDNCSTDGSSEAAERYACRFPGKIRLIERPRRGSCIHHWQRLRTRRLCWRALAAPQKMAPCGENQGRAYDLSISMRFAEGADGVRAFSAPRSSPIVHTMWGVLFFHVAPDNSLSRVFGRSC